MLSRISTIFWMILIVVSALGVYLVKYQVQSMQEELVKLENNLREERESLHVLEAEWAYLNRPERLQELADRHLPLMPSLSKQISSVEAIPQTADLVAKAEEAEEPAAQNSPITPVRAVVHAR